MNDAISSAGMLRGWVMLWNVGLTGLLAAIVLGLGVAALIHVVA